jgi:hypothetical protein
MDLSPIYRYRPTHLEAKRPSRCLLSRVGSRKPSKQTSWHEDRAARALVPIFFFDNFACLHVLNSR